jgi:hypothetical protein
MFSYNIIHIKEIIIKQVHEGEKTTTLIMLSVLDVDLASKK